MEEKRYTGLKILVIGLGLVLVVGFIALGVVMYMKLHASEDAQTNTAFSSPPAPACASARADLTGLGRAMNADTRGQLLRLTLAKPDGTVTVVTLDSCSGKILQRFTVMTDR